MIRSHCFALFLLPLLLTACVSREQADATLARGCEAAVGVLLPEGAAVNKITGQSFSPSPEGAGFRHVKLKAVENDGWLEVEKDYECVFEESFGPFKANHTASIYQVKTGDRVVGRAGKDILGSAEDFLKLSDAIRKAMYEN